MPISAERIQTDIDAIAAFTETPGEGATRPTFSNAWRQARDYVIGQLESAGCKTRIDAAGNVHARPSAIGWESPVWISGSHLDTVPHGGNFDGVVGVVAPLEVIRAAREELKVAVPLELVIWAEEEGTTFGLGMLGSRAYVGEMSATQLATLKNAAGQNYLQAGEAYGVRPGDIANPAERFARSSAIGLIEVHVEQGPGLWNQECPIAIVTAIAGRRQYRCIIGGAANHAGSTMMEDRRDALAGSAEIILAVEKLARDLGHRSVITVGQLRAHPNAINVINDEVNFSIDFRSAAMEVLARGDRSIASLVEHIAAQRGLRHHLAVTESQPAMEMDRQVIAKIARVASPHCDGGQIQRTISGALHDAAILAPHVPTAMLFVASRDGISHNPNEFTRLSDIATAARVLFDAVRDRRLE
jgi:hydantoinase/carbamoylase family amidase